MNDPSDIEELTDTLFEVIDEYSTRLSAGMVVGVIEMVKLDLWTRAHKHTDNPVPPLPDIWLDE